MIHKHRNFIVTMVNRNSLFKIQRKYKATVVESSIYADCFFVRTPVIAMDGFYIKIDDFGKWTEIVLGDGANTHCKVEYERRVFDK